MKALLFLLLLISRQQWGSQPQPLPEALRQTPKRIVIHHGGVRWKEGADPYAVVRNLQSWGQREKGWPDLPYHYLIAPDGTVFEGRDWHYRPESNTQYELEGVLNVELMGNFEEEPVPEAQLAALRETLVWLCREHALGAGDIVSHRDMAPGQTVCPGADLYRRIPELRSSVESELAH